MDKWEQRNRPIRLEKRFEFNSYEGTRKFLDQLGEYCEKESRFPDISFGKTYVNITVRPKNEDESEALTNEDYQFSQVIDGLFD